MILLAIAVEGETEEAFVNKVLADVLQRRGVDPTPILLGGDVRVERVAAEMAKLYWSFDFVTSLVDFYGFRGKSTETREELEQLILQAVGHEIHRAWNESRVFPYVQQYEFEGLLFSDVTTFATSPDAPDGCVEQLRWIRSQFKTPEDINDSWETAPSKRVMSVIPRYNKVVNGSLIAEAIGWDIIRDGCPRFNDWLSHVELLRNNEVG